VKISLANSEPSTHGTSRHSTAAQQFARFVSEADIERMLTQRPTRVTRRVHALLAILPRAARVLLTFGVSTMQAYSAVIGRSSSTLAVAFTEGPNSESGLSGVPRAGGLCTAAQDHHLLYRCAQSSA
jgi:hypothetical protein